MLVLQIWVQIWLLLFLPWSMLLSSAWHPSVSHASGRFFKPHWLLPSCRCGPVPANCTTLSTRNNWFKWAQAPSGAWGPFLKGNMDTGGKKNHCLYWIIMPWPAAAIFSSRGRDLTCVREDKREAQPGRSADWAEALFRLICSLNARISGKAIFASGLNPSVMTDCISRGSTLHFWSLLFFHIIK